MAMPLFRTPPFYFLTRARSRSHMNCRNGGVHPFSSLHFFMTTTTTMAAADHPPSDLDDSEAIVHVGLVEAIEDEEQLRRVGHRSPNFEDWDGGQVGGCPSFLDPEHVPDAPRCSHCEGTTMQFVCQLYAPVDEFEDRAFHRSFYVFACRKCQSDDDHDDNTAHTSFRVYRCQLPQDNPYYPSDPSSQENLSAWKQHLPDSHGVHLCQICGMRGQYKCPLQQLYFCGRDHQKEYKRHVFDKLKNGEAPSDCLPSVFPIAELLVESEILPEISLNNDPERETLFQGNDDGDDSDAELEQEDLNRMTGKKDTVEHDSFTHTFMERIKAQPDQVLRYARWRAGDNDLDEANDARVLWIRKDHRPTTIPDCPYCGAPRRFEFQLMPQMLDHLNRNAKVDDEASTETYRLYKDALQRAEDLIREAPPEAIPPSLVENKERAMEKMRQYLLRQRRSSLEFGTVAVFTCTQSCGATGTLGQVDRIVGSGNASYREEFAWRQACLDSF
jgi:pre-rRNA-processing protein TSR4